MAAKIRRHHDRLCDGHTLCTRDDSTYLKLSTSILSKALHVSHWRRLAFHKIANLKHKFATIFIHIAYHHYVVNIYFKRVQSSLESCTTSKLTDRLTNFMPNELAFIFESLRSYVRYNINSCKLP
jgi:hypothetical protein